MIFTRERILRIKNDDEKGLCKIVEMAERLFKPNRSPQGWQRTGGINRAKTENARKIQFQAFFGCAR